MFGASRLALFAANPVAAAAGVVYSAGGYDNSNLDTVSGNNQRTNKIYKYALSNDAVSLMGITLSNYVDAGQAFGNQTLGIIAGGGTGDSSGNPVTAVNIITFSTEAKTSGTALSQATRQGKCGSTSTKGYVFCPLSSASTLTNSRYDYTYSSGSSTYNTNNVGFGTVRRDVYVHNNTTKAVVGGGWISSGTTPQTSIREFTFASETWADASYSLYGAIGQPQCAGNQDKYAVLGGFANAGASTLNTRVETYAFSDGTRVAATSMNGHRLGDAAGDDTYGIFSGAFTFGSGITATKANKKYTYSSDTWIETTAIYTVAIDGNAMLCSTQTN